MSKTWGEIREEALRKCGQLPPKTNADRIRGMSDEELAECLCCWDNSPLHASRERWLDWLKSQVEVEK